jgi:hypothetical protein
MSTHRVSLFVVLTALTLGASARAAEPQRSVFNFRGLTGQAQFSRADSCQITSVQIIGNQNVSHSTGGQPVTTDFATVIYISFNFCTGDFRILSGSGDATVDGSLQGLSITGTIPVFDTSGLATSVTLDVSLSPVGDVTHSVENFGITSRDLTVQVRSVGASTSATATGSLSDGTTDLLAGLGTGGGSIAQTNGGTVTIIRGQ